MSLSNPHGATSAGSFRCVHCGATVTMRAPGTRHRNHCPICLHSQHRDHAIGDRAARCDGVMAPLAVAARGDGEWSLLHRCASCGTLRLTRTAGDDNPAALLALAARPLAHPPFPLDRPIDIA